MLARKLQLGLDAPKPSGQSVYSMICRIVVKGSIPRFACAWVSFDVYKTSLPHSNQQAFLCWKQGSGLKIVSKYGQSCWNPLDDPKKILEHVGVKLWLLWFILISFMFAYFCYPHLAWSLHTFQVYFHCFKFKDVKFNKSSHATSIQNG